MGSNLSIFKIGVGPSSSHTVGPMLAGNLFCELITPHLQDVKKIKIELYGSLSLTGKGHLTDLACIIGLSGIKAQELTPTSKESILHLALNDHKLNLAGTQEIPFFYEEDVVFYRDFLPLHENGMRLNAFDAEGKLICSQVYYSIGGGFIATEEELKNPSTTSGDSKLELDFTSAKDLLELCSKYHKSIAEISMEFEKQFHTQEEIEKYCLEIWDAMQESYRNGCEPNSEILPGPLKLKRRAPELYRKHKSTSSDPLAIVDSVSLYAIAVAEENGAGGKVVTAPTNGACAVVPAVMLYLQEQLKERFGPKMVVDFLLTAMAIGSLYKKNASISGAEAGCQAEMGSASSMAAGAMAMVMGATPAQVCSAAEIAMEHHLGLTCDPVAGLVQIPCIERNAFGAIKAISAARMAMSRESDPTVGLDEVILTMYQTGKDMDLKYKETSLGGLAKTFGSVC
ncbi:L-serine ammonia-lyase [Helicobacter pametensis]|uniref:L-serine ammonia-lyase n=1 Tax=Helicobacter pametensis TaxID=95149 RepID=UPI000487863D|nr:L-serine ammonia-lyase [Helicobacter pametensis]